MNLCAARRLRPGPLLRVAALAFGVAVATYLHGVWVGHLLDLRSVDEFCVGKPRAIPSTSETAFPLRHLCNWADGTTTNLVPVYVNVLLVFCLVVIVGCIGLAIFTARRMRQGQ